ncbi:MAG: hypothetical protein GY839_03635 [candidate division Zixibacteria bacterium]|nr:hypothetical protein [candidate division Zixibacteria bacterium]
MHNFVAKSNQNLIRKAKKLKKMVDHMEEILKILELDQRLLTDSSTKRIYFCVDFHDIFKFAYPLLDISNGKHSSVIRNFTRRATKFTDLIDEQVGRNTFFFGLPDKFYPHMLLYPHYLELRNVVFHTTPKQNIPTHGQIKSSISNVYNLETKLAEWADKIKLIPEDKDLSRDELEMWNTLAEKTPDLLYIITNLFGNGMKLIHTLYSNHKINTDTFRWNILRSLKDKKDRVNLVEHAYAKDPNPIWLELINTIRPDKKHKPQNYVDAMAITIVENLNKLLNKHGMYIFLMSSAYSMSVLLDKARDCYNQGEDINPVIKVMLDKIKLDNSKEEVPNLEKRECKKSEEEIPILRNFENFRFYNHYLTQLNKNDNNSNTILSLIRSDLKMIDSVKDIASHIEDFVDFVREQQIANVSTSDEYNDQIQIHIEAIKKFIDNAQGLRRKWFNIQSFSDSETYLKPYTKWDPNLKLIKKIMGIEKEEEKAHTIKKTLVEAIDLLRDTSRYHSLVIEKIFGLKITLMSEMLLSIGGSKFISQINEMEFLYLQKFRRFPYHLKFRNNDLKRDVEILQELMSNPNKRPNPAPAVHHLSKMIRELSDSRYWIADSGNKPDILDNPERLLASYAFLFALGHADLVKEGIDNIFSKNTKISSNPKFSLYIDEFKFINTYAELELGDFDRTTCKNFLESNNLNKENILNKPDFIEKLDPRIVHLAAYLAGYGFRKDTPHEDFDFETILRLRRRSVEILEDRKSTELLKVMSKSCLSYTLAISEEEADVEEAKTISDEIADAWGTDKMFRGCMHARGFVLYRYAKIKTDVPLAERYELAKDAVDCLKEAKKRQRYGAPLVRGKTRLPKDIKKAEDFEEDIERQLKLD